MSRAGKRVQRVDDGLKQTNLLSFFVVTKSANESNTTQKHQKKTKTKTVKRKSPKIKQKEVKSESEDDGCDSYCILKLQKENLTQDLKVVTINKPTPLKKNCKINLKVVQVRDNIMGSERKKPIPNELEKNLLHESPKKSKIEYNEAPSSSRKQLFGNEDKMDPLREMLNTSDQKDDEYDMKENNSTLDLDATEIMDNIDLAQYGVYNDDSSSSDVSFVSSDEIENGGTFTHFNQIINYVENQPNLFSVLFEQEQQMLKVYGKLPQQYRYFCFRLFKRQLIWYEVNSLQKKIKFEMDPDMVKKMIKILEKKKFVKTDYSKEEPVDLLNRLLVNDVKIIYQSFKIKGKHKKKDDLIKAILNHCSSQSTLTAGKSLDDLLMGRINEKMGDSVKLELSLYNTLARVHLLYSFMNPDIVKPSDLYLFMQSIQLKETKLPTFSTDFTTVFTREKFLRYFLAVEHYNEYMIAKEFSDEKKMLKIAKLSFDDFREIVSEKYDDEKTTVLSFYKRFTAGRVLAKILSMACKQFTRDSDRILEWLEFLVKQDQYALKRRGEWYTHIAMIHEKHNEFDLAVDVLIQAFVDPHVPDISKYELSHRASRLVNKCDDKDASNILSELILLPPDYESFPFIVITAKQNTENAGMRLKYHLNGGTVVVEEVALNHYRENGFSKGLHCEGQLMITIYILLFWDIIFDKYVPGTFISEIQYIPLDFYSSDFYENRKMEVDKRLEEIETAWTQEEFERSLRASILEHHDIFTLTTLAIVQGDVIMDAVKCMGRKVLRMILERFVKNFRDHRAGMPDLFIFNPNTLQYKFVEVKSENDNLSMKQKVWLNFLRSIGAVIEMCHVNSEGRKVKRKLLKKKN